MLKRLLSTLSIVGFLTSPSVVRAGEAQQGTAFEYEFRAIDGAPMPLSEFKGKVLLIVNTASFCGFTKQYGGLQQLWERYEGRGLVVIGVPSNDFGEQEPGSEKEIKAFCEGAFNITFPLTAKYPVKGPAAHPFYQWARATLGERAAPRWNFHKYLVGRDGKLVGGYSASVAPDSDVLVREIEKSLGAG